MPLSQEDLTERLELAISAGLSAGQITLKYFGRSNFQVEQKADNSPVTIADRESEDHLRERISEVFPEDGILGEERPEKPGTNGFRWILDPIDGTKSFVQGVPLYGTMIGLEYEGRSVVGFVGFPGLNEYVYAAQGEGAWHVLGDSAPKPARVSEVSSLSESLLCITANASFYKVDRWDACLELEKQARLTRTWGDCYGYMLVATGRAEVMTDPAMNVWDAAALQPILEEAGGTFTDWQGNSTIHGGEGVATNGRVLDEVLAVTRRYQR